MIDLEQTNLFLSKLGSPPYIFQTFTDNKEQKKATPRDPLARVLTGTLQDHCDTLQALSDRGAGVFVQVNGGQQRGNEAISQIRALWIDIDAANRSAETLSVVSRYMPKPSILVKSSPGKYHAYWLIDDLPVNQFKIYQAHLFNRFKTDPSMGNLDRVMRLPGFPHRKHQPYLVTAQHFNTRYTKLKLDQWVGEIPEGLLTDFDVPSAPKIPPPPTAKKTNNPFGIDMPDAYEEPTVLAPGERTTKLIQHIGALVQRGNDEAYIRDEVSRMNIDLCPADSEPIDPATLEQEVLGCIPRFIEKRAQEIRQLHGDSYAEASSVDQVLPPPPPPAAIVELLEAAVVERNDLASWLTRFIYIVDKRRVADSGVKGEWSIMELGEFEKQHIGAKASKTMKMTNAWLHHPDRLTVRGVIYKPIPDAIITDTNEQKFFNSYQPANIAPAYQVDMNKIEVFMEHIIYLFPKDEDRDVFLGWFCYTVTQPTRSVTWAPALVSTQGSGKGWILDVMKILMGAANVKPITPDRIENQFNTFLFNSTLVCVYDMYKSGSRQLDGKLKGYIDVTETEANKKNVGERTEKVWSNFLIFLNRSDDLYVEPGDRRFWMVDLPDPKTPAYYNRLFSWLDEPENFPHLLKWCQDYKSQLFNPTAPPGSKLKRDVVNRNKSEIQVELETSIEERIGPFDADLLSFETVMDYLSTALNIQTTHDATRATVRKVWGVVSQSLKTERVHIICGRLNTRRRVRCVRRVEYWNLQTPRALGVEASKAATLMLEPQSTTGAKNDKST